MFVNFFLELSLFYYNFNYFYIAIYIHYFNTFGYYLKCKLMELININLKNYN